MFGQEKLLKTLNSYTLQTLPKSLLFIGEFGCGKHTIVRDLSNRLGLPLVEVNSSDNLIDYQQATVAKMYLINLNNFTEKQQNQFLKFIEEPSKYVYISLIADSEIGVLATILNRCIKYHFEPYSVEDLRKVNWLDITVDELIYKICRTPGQVLLANSTEINKLYEFCQDLIKNITKMPLSALLAITVPQINFKEDYDKFEFTTFFKMLEYVVFQDYINTKNLVSFKLYKASIEMHQKLVGKSLNKEAFMISYLIYLWRAVK